MENNIPKIEIKVTVNGKHIESDLKAELLVDNQDDLKQHMNEISAKFAYWGVLKIEAGRNEKNLKTEYKKWLAEKKKAIAGTGKFTSETAKEDAVLTTYTEEYAAKMKEMIEAEYNHNLLKMVVESWGIKKDMLISICAQIRQEMSCLSGSYKAKEDEQDISSENGAQIIK